MLAEVGDEELCVFVWEVHSRTVEELHGDGRGDELSEAVCPFGMEEGVPGAPDDQGGCGEGGECAGARR